MQLGHWAAHFTIFGGVLILFAYAFGIERVWRPITGAPASHPLTAVLFICGSRVKPADTRPSPVGSKSGDSAVAEVPEIAQCLSESLGLAVLLSARLFDSLELTQGDVPPSLIVLEDVFAAVRRFAH
jgi:hypothetical protein